MSGFGVTEPNAFGGSGEIADAVNLFASPISGDSGNPGADGSASGGASGGDDRTFDPERHISPDKRNADGSFRRKRAKRGTGGGSSSPAKPRTAKADRLGIEGLTRMLVIIHAGIAATTKTEEMVIDEGEAQMLAASTANLLEQFDIRPDPKIEAAIGLVTAASIVYGPRIIAIRNRKKMEAANTEE